MSRQRALHRVAYIHSMLKRQAESRLAASQQEVTRIDKELIKNRQSFDVTTLRAQEALSKQDAIDWLAAGLERDLIIWQEQSLKGSRQTAAQQCEEAHADFLKSRLASEQSQHLLRSVLQSQQKANAKLEQKQLDEFALLRRANLKKS